MNYHDLHSFILRLDRIDGGLSTLTQKLILAVHTVTLMNDFLCIGTEEELDHGEDLFLPPKWKLHKDGIYTLAYRNPRNNEILLMKMFFDQGELAVNAVCSSNRGRILSSSLDLELSITRKEAGVFMFNEENLRFITERIEQDIFEKGNMKRVHIVLEQKPPAKVKEVPKHQKKLAPKIATYSYLSPLVNSAGHYMQSPLTPPLKFSNLYPEMDTTNSYQAGHSTHASYSNSNPYHSIVTYTMSVSPIPNSPELNMFFGLQSF
eukprot:TRINITY_DN17596_c0_g1_i1.p1 TRINITY_DN17596_c0_g1~~TRINITY_DN17596_c0_g1_i1.p1  ORF type:complete len:263 (+),score=37.93 TRINITY_DN17596_c0_g1_i1:231-1019(+)